MKRVSILAYGLVCYAIFFGTFLWLVGFLGNFGFAKTIDSGEPGSVWAAIFGNSLLLVLFGVQHSVMARPAFKSLVTRAVPQPLERSNYVLATSAVLLLLMGMWQPLPAVVLEFEGSASVVVTGLFFAGVGLVLLSTFWIDHFDLFGLRQVWLHFRGRPYGRKRFAAPFLYRHIRHPLYVGWFATLWFAPTMTAGHLLFAGISTAYILLAVVYEERDLAQYLGDDYLRWREQTPMFVPRLARPGAAGGAAQPGSR